jgi:precorrin-6A synthase
VRRLVVIGVGGGDPDQLTVQAIDALAQVDVVFVVDKGEAAADLAAARAAILRRHRGDRPVRVVEIDEVPRDRAPRSYEAEVGRWHDERTQRYAAAITSGLGDRERGAFLAWGDPALYDSTVRILDAIAREHPGEIEYEVVPGVSSISALAAAHRVTLNQVGRPVLITTGRLLADHGWPDGVDDVVVMLDGRAAFRTVDVDADIYWAANLGLPGEALVAGRLRDVADEIVRRRDEVRAARGWVFDVYLLRRRGSAEPT